MNIWNSGEEELFVWIFISFAHISSSRVSCFYALSLNDSVMTDSHSLFSQKKDLYGFSSLVLSCLLNSSSRYLIRIFVSRDKFFFWLTIHLRVVEERIWTSVRASGIKPYPNNCFLISMFLVSDWREDWKE